MSFSDEEKESNRKKMNEKFFRIYTEVFGLDEESAKKLGTLIKKVTVSPYTSS